MTRWAPETVADELYQAERDRRERAPFTDEWPEFDVASAYRSQRLLLERKVAAGERVMGIKLGLTSTAKQQRMGISSPLTAWITDAMLLPDGVRVPMGELIHPRIEPEIVFVLGDRLAGPGVTRGDVLAAVRSVHAGFEVIDSRYRDFRFRLPDVVADNASSSRFYVGARALAPTDLDLVVEECRLVVDGKVVDSATGAAVQGHPADALAHAVNALGERGIAVEPGWTVLTGGLTDAVFVHPGVHFSAEFTHLGSVTATA